MFKKYSGRQFHALLPVMIVLSLTGCTSQGLKTLSLKPGGLPSQSEPEIATRDEQSDHSEKSSSFDETKTKSNSEKKQTKSSSESENFSTKSKNEKDPVAEKQDDRLQELLRN